MLLEICVPKMIAPLFGSSMYVWSSVISVSVGSLAIGYFTGGRLSRLENIKKYLLIFVGFCLIYTTILPHLFTILKDYLLVLDVKQGSLLLSFILLFPILTCFGAMSPLIIQLLSSMSKNTAYAGFIYAISTIGGIFACLIGAFYLIPFLGVVKSIHICGLLLVIVMFALISIKNNTDKGINLPKKEISHKIIKEKIKVNN
ncbi:MAG: fused MFS/spermidine synthase [Thermodesulfovibrionales bacterium]|nr:fused MFS/spermidine synthase [Thermodesulfovibrionales bacterium]